MAQIKFSANSMAMINVRIVLALEKACMKCLNYGREMISRPQIFKIQFKGPLEIQMIVDSEM